MLFKISIWAISIVVIASAITFQVAYDDARQRVIGLLEQDLAPALERNEAFFDHVEENGDILAQQFLSNYKRDVALGDELKSRVIAAQYTLNELGPAWQNEVSNSHFSMPENILLM